MAEQNTQITYEEARNTILNTHIRFGRSNRKVLFFKAILKAVGALEKQIPEKPTYVDTRFRNLGRHISDGCSLDKCYKCPNCKHHIFHVFDSEKYCIHCGQALDWEVD